MEDSNASPWLPACPHSTWKRGLSCSSPETDPLSQHSASVLLHICTNSYTHTHTHTTRLRVSYNYKGMKGLLWKR